jgi:hypothetical protein
MKRVGLFILTVIIVMCAMTSCVIIPIYKNFEIDADTVASIEIYDLREADSLYSNFVKTESPVYEIPQEKKAAFLNDLAEIHFSDAIIIVLAAIDPSFYYDVWTIRINYTDGSYELISSDGYEEAYDSNGESVDIHHFGCDQEEWWAFIGKYVPEDIFNYTHETE